MSQNLLLLPTQLQFIHFPMLFRCKTPHAFSVRPSVLRVHIPRSGRYLLDGLDSQYHHQEIWAAFLSGTQPICDWRV